MDYLLPTAIETPDWKPAKPARLRRIIRSAPKASASPPPSARPLQLPNAVVDALWHLGVRHLDIPITPWKVWEILNEKGVAE